jgi:hypothetical protein
VFQVLGTRSHAASDAIQQSLETRMLSWAVIGMLVSFILIIIVALFVKLTEGAKKKLKWVRARSMLVYLAREWSGMSAKELGKELHRDPSIVSRLYTSYGENRIGRSRIDCCDRSPNKSIRMPDRLL